MTKLIRTLHIEMIKLKRSPMVWVSVLGVAIAPILNYLIFLSLKANNSSAISIERYFDQCYVFFAVLIATMMFGLIATYIFNREYQEGTYGNMLTIPTGRTEVIISKMIILFGWIFFLILFNFGLSIFLNYMGLFIKFSKEIIINYLKVYLLTGVLHFALMPVTIFITLIFKNYIPSIGFSVFVTISSLILTDTKFGELFPWSLTYLLATSQEEFYYPISYSIASIVLTFIISLTACIVYFNKLDVQ